MTYRSGLRQGRGQSPQRVRSMDRATVLASFSSGQADGSPANTLSIFHIAFRQPLRPIGLIASIPADIIRKITPTGYSDFTDTSPANSGGLNAPVASSVSNKRHSGESQNEVILSQVSQALTGWGSR